MSDEASIRLEHIAEAYEQNLSVQNGENVLYKCRLYNNLPMNHSGKDHEACLNEAAYISLEPSINK